MMSGVDVYKFENIPKLTSEQEKSPFAKFYYVPIPDPEPEIAKAFGEEQMPVEDAVDFSHIERLYAKDSDTMKNGWCMMPDGTGYSHVETKMPNVTPEIDAWWNQFIFDPDYDFLNYRIWMPSLHFSHAMPIVEDIGWGACKVMMTYILTLQDLNLSAPPAELDPDFLYTLGSSGSSQLVEGDPKNEYVVLINCIKRLGNGIRMQSVAYMGMKWEDGKMVKAHDADPLKTRLFGMHNAYEFCRKAQLAPEVYEAAKDLPNMGLNTSIKPPVM